VEKDLWECNRTAYSFIMDNKRIFGADNTGYLHVHPHKVEEIPFDISNGEIFEDFSQK